MNLNKLSNALREQAGSTGKIVLAQEVLSVSGAKNASDVYKDLAKYLGLSSDLEITGLSQDNIPDPQNHVLSINAGFIQFLNAKMNVVKLEFSVLEEETLYLVLEAQINSNAEDPKWHLYTSFPAFFAFTHLDDLLKNSSFIFSSDNKDGYSYCQYTGPIERGLNFYAELEPPEVSVLRLATALVQESPKLYLFGPIDVTNPQQYDGVHTLPFIDLKYSFPGLELDHKKLCNLIPIKSPRLGLRLVESPDDGTEFSFSITPELYFSVEIPITEEKSLDFFATLNTGSHFLSFSVEVEADNKEESVGLSMEDILQALLGEKDAQQWKDAIPAPFKDALDTFTFQGFSATVFFDQDNKPILSSSTTQIGAEIPSEKLPQACQSLGFQNFNFYANWTTLYGTETADLWSFGAEMDFLDDAKIIDSQFDVEIVKQQGDSGLIIGGNFKGKARLGELLNKLCASKPSITPPFDFDILGMQMEVDTRNNAYTFALQAAGIIDVGSTELDFPLIACDISFQNEISITLNVSWQIGKYIFSLYTEYSPNEATTWLFRGSSYNTDISLTTFLKGISKELGLELPDVLPDVSFSNPDIQLSFGGDSETKELQRLLLSAVERDGNTKARIEIQKTPKGSWDTSIDLNYASAPPWDLFQYIPIISHPIDDKITLAIDSFQIKYTTPNGIDFKITLQLEQQVTLQRQPDAQDGTTQETSTSVLAAVPSGVPPSNNATDSSVIWYNVQKSLGPIVLSRIGAGYDTGRLWLLLDAGLHAKVLALDLLGLGLGLKPQDLVSSPPSLKFNGLGLRLQSGPVMASGMLLEAPPADASIQEQYDGEIAIQLESLNVTAYGSYAKLQDAGKASFFAFSVIDYPLGGPPAFFVTGGAVGMGYNRALKLPNIKAVSTYPLIEAANNPNDYKNLGIAEVLKRFGEITPMQTGEYWLSAGIQFTSFEQIKSFALATVSFGTQLEIALLGLSTVKIPAEGPTIAEAQLALEVRIFPDEGFAGVDVALTPNSYVLDKECVLTGGAAFYAWFGTNTNAGDFILTLGGYHPRFDKPAHYPSVPRLGFHWNVDNHLTLKGTMYFALTPVCIMAGGSMSAVWQSGGIMAWFNLSADLLIFWKPYYYDITARADIGVSLSVKILFVHTHVTAHLSADMHIWGPDFSGTAHIHLWIVSFTLSFGASNKKNVDAVEWSDFKQSFLGANDKIVRITVANGLRKTVAAAQSSQSTHLIVDSDHFSFVTNSLIPSTQAKVLGKAQNLQDSYNISIGVGMVGVAAGSFESTHTISLTKDGKDYSDEQFLLEPITQTVSKALWQYIPSQELVDQGVQSDTTLSNVLVGYRITLQHRKPENTLPVKLENLLYSHSSTEPIIAYAKPAVPTEDSFDQVHALKEIQGTIVGNAKRTQILNCLQNNDYNAEISVETLANQATCGYFIESPLLRYIGEEKSIEPKAA